MSHLGRIGMGLDNSHMRNSKARQFNPTSLFGLCVSDSPEGSMCGIIRNLCVTAHVTQPLKQSDMYALYCTIIHPELHVKRIPVSRALPGSCFGSGRMDVEDVSSVNACHALLYDLTFSECVVLLNGAPVGTHPDAAECVWALRDARRHGWIHFSVSISHNVECTAVYVSCVMGRILQPVLVVDYDTQLVKLPVADATKPIHWLVSHGYLEMLDEAELGGLTVALYMEELQNTECVGPFTHCVLHPSLMLSACTHLGTFHNHVQSPRNAVHTSMHKQAIASPSIPNSNNNSAGYSLFYPQAPLVPNRYGHIQFRGCEAPSQQLCVVAITV
jgi:DNA-directed RNA polymerase beta subunit